MNSEVSTAGAKSYPAVVGQRARRRVAYRLTILTGFVHTATQFYAAPSFGGC